MIAVDMPTYLPQKYSVDFSMNEVQRYSDHASKECKNDFLLIDGSENKIKSFKENVVFESKNTPSTNKTSSVSTKSCSFGHVAFVFEKGVSIRLKKNIQFQKIGNEIHIQEWDIKFPPSDLLNIHKYICRQFSLLYHKAKENELSETEMATWLKIVDSVDYYSFLQEISKPMYAKGKILKLSDGYVEIKWQSGQKEKIAQNTSTCFEYLKRGDDFCAYVKRGKDGIVLRLDNVLIDTQPLSEFSIMQLTVKEI